MADVIKIYNVYSVEYNENSRGDELEPLTLAVEDFVREKGYDSYVKHEFVTAPYSIFPRPGGLNYGVNSSIYALVTIRESE